MGLPEEVFIAKFLESTRDWLGADTGHFIWCDRENLEPVNYSGDGFRDISAVQRFFSHNSKISYPGVMPAFSDLMQTSSSGLLGAGEGGAYLKSDLYQDVMRPCDGRYMLFMVVHDIKGTPKGLMSLLRTSSDRPFTNADHGKLIQIEPYLRYALSVDETPGSMFDSADNEGMVVLALNGDVRYQDITARKLLWMACHDRIDRNALIHLDSQNITPQLRRLHHRLISTFEGRDEGPPFFECNNSWGRFVFRGSWLSGDEQRAVGIRVNHHIPRALKAWTGLHKLDLPPRQQQVALLLSEGLTLNEISLKLGISRHTVPEYVQVIYERLNIAPNREALQQALLS
jgi:DNA-binding CsgD family transcriptional regulator